MTVFHRYKIDDSAQPAVRATIHFDSSYHPAQSRSKIESWTALGWAEIESPVPPDFRRSARSAAGADIAVWTAIDVELAKMLETGRRFLLKARV